MSSWIPADMLLEVPGGATVWIYPSGMRNTYLFENSFSPLSKRSFRNSEIIPRAALRGTFEISLEGLS